MKYIIKINEPFRGYVQSILLDSGVVAWSNGMTFDEYCFANGPHKIIDDDDLDRLIAQWEASMMTAPVEETREEYKESLEVLTPSRWTTHLGVELFHVSERLSGSLVSWHARLGQRYWTFTDVAHANLDELAAKVAAVAAR